MRTINFILNGEQVSAQVAEHQSIVEVLRDRFELSGARESCAQGLCGCWPVLVTGLPCPAASISRRSVRQKVPTGEGSGPRQVSRSRSVLKPRVQCGSEAGPVRGASRRTRPRRESAYCGTGVPDSNMRGIRGDYGNWV